MSDPDETGDGGIPQTLVSWALTAYGIASWPVKEGADLLRWAVSFGPSAMKVLQDKLTPRPEQTKAPGDASTAETLAVDTAYQTLTDHIAANIDSNDDANARQQLKDIALLITQSKTAAAARSAFDAKRQAMDVYLRAIPFSTEFTPEEMRDFAKRRSQIARALTAATDLAQLVPIETAYENLRDDVAAAQSMVLPSKDAASDIGTAEATRAAIVKIVDRGYHEAVVEAIATAKTALAAAVKATDITSLRAALSAVMGKEVDARTYAANFDSWCLKAEGYLVVYAPDPPARDRRSAARELRNDLADAAAKKAAALDFNGARGELAKFAVNPIVTRTGDFAQSGAFMAQLATFLKTHDAKRVAIKQSKIRCASYMDKGLSDIRRKGIVDQQWAQAQAQLTAFQSRIDVLHPLALKLREVLEIKGSIPDTEEPLRSMLAAKATANGTINSDGTGDVAIALAAFAGIAGAAQNEVTALRRLGVITKRSKAARDEGHAATDTHISGHFAAVKVDIKSDLAKANATMATLEALLDAVERWMPEIADARAQRAVSDPTNAYNLLAAAEVDATGHAYDAAKTKATAAIENYGYLTTYTRLVAQMVLVQGAQVAASPAHVLVSTALTQADDLARVQGKIAQGVTRLQAVLADAVLAEAAHEAGLWETQLDAVQKRHDKITPRMAPPATQATMIALFDAAKTKAITDHDFPTAMPMLEAYGAKLIEARDYLAARDRVGTVKSALDRTVAQFSTDPDIQTKVYGAPDDADMRAKITAAEVLATAGKVKDAGLAV